MTKKLLSEFIGTYFLVFAGTGAIMVDNLTQSLSIIGIAFTFGLVIMAMIYTTINNLWLYIAATILGALASAIVYKFLHSFER